MYVETIPNRGAQPTVLIREAWREGKKIRRRTVGNITSLPERQIEQIRRTLKGEELVSSREAFEILRARPHGHVAAVVGMMNKLGIPELLSTRFHRPVRSHPGAKGGGGALKEEVEQLERHLITEALATTRGNILKAAEILKLSRAGLHKKLKRYNIDPRNM